MKRVHLISLGCPKNRVDTETMLAALPGVQHQLTTRVEDADVVIVNTCAFIEDAKQESIDTILEMAELRKANQLGKLIVTGCLSQRYPEELAEELPEVDHFIGTDPTLVAEILDDRNAPRLRVTSPDRLGYQWDAPRLNSMGYSSYLKVAEGCSNSCAFCIIPALRGPQRSRGIDSIVAEAERLAGQGVLELNLVAQDLTAYGFDLQPRLNLTHMLEALAQVDGIRWIRLLYAYPRSFPKGLIELMAREEKIVPYLDMPLQHISDPVLKAMRRGTNAETIRKRVAELRAQIPHITLRTTLLVGHPGETEDDFKRLLEFVEATRFERLGAFAYSREENTPSHDLPHQLPEAVKAERLDRLMFTQRQIAREHNEALVGREVEVLVERVSEESELVMIGRAASQAPEIDGICYMGLHDGIEPGQIIKAEITQVTDYDLAVEPLD